MFFLNISPHFVKTLFFTKMNLALIRIFLPIINHFERVKNNAFAIHDFVLQNEIFSRVGPHLNLSLSHTLFHKIRFDLNSFYDIKRLESLLESFSFFLLLVTVLIYWFETAFHSKAEKQEFPSSMVKLSNLSLTFLLGTRWITSHHFPLSNLYESLIFLSWSLTVIHLILEKISHTLLIGVLLSPITLFINGFALFTLPAEMQKGNFLTPALQSNWLMMHVTVMISSYAALLSGSILAIAFLVITRNTAKNDRSLFCETKYKENVIAAGLASQEGDVFYHVKNKNHESPNFISQNRTSLAATLDNLSYRTIGIGFPLLTIGILSGAVWANEAWGSYWSWDPKETWALITWFLFAIYLHTRITKGLQGEKPAIIATIGFVVVWICFLGVNLASQGLHTYGWLQ